MVRASDLKKRVERLNEKTDRDFTLESRSMGGWRAYQLDDEENRHVNPRGATASEMNYFLDGVFAGLRMASDSELTVKFQTQGPDGDWKATKRSDEEIDLSGGVGHVSSVGVPARIVVIK